MNKTRPKQNAAEHRAVLISKVAAAEQARDTAVALARACRTALDSERAEHSLANSRAAQNQVDDLYRLESARSKLDAALQLLRDYDSVKTAAQHKDWTARRREMTGK
jgi:hypothetical protein